MIKEYDVVKAKSTLSEKIRMGMLGTVVMIYDNPNLAYEVEFESDGSTELMTVSIDEIEKCN